MARQRNKYYPGMLLKHYKYKFTIRLVEKNRWDNWIWELVSGVFPENLRPSGVYSSSPTPTRVPVYSSSNLRRSFIPLTESTAGRLLYEN